MSEHPEQLKKEFNELKQSVQTITDSIEDKMDDLEEKIEEQEQEHSLYPADCPIEVDGEPCGKELTSSRSARGHLAAKNHPSITELLPRDGGEVKCPAGCDTTADDANALGSHMRNAHGVPVIDYIIKNYEDIKHDLKKTFSQKYGFERKVEVEFTEQMEKHLDELDWAERYPGLNAQGTVARLLHAAATEEIGLDHDETPGVTEEDKGSNTSEETVSPDQDKVEEIEKAVEDAIENEKNYECKKCGAGFDEYESSVDHIHTQHGINNIASGITTHKDDFTCPMNRDPDHFQGSGRSLAAHLWNSHGMTFDEFYENECPICDSGVEDVSTHMRETHEIPVSVYAGSE